MCFWTILWTTFSNNWPVMDRRLIRRKFWGNFWSLPGFGNVMMFASFQDFGKWDSRRQWLNKCVKCTNGRPGRCPRHSFGMPSIPQDFLNFKEWISFCKSHVLILSRGLLNTALSRAWTLVSTRHSWFSSHRSSCVNWFSKQSAIVLAFSDGWNLRPQGPWMAVGALGPSLFRRDFAMGRIARGVTSVLPIFVPTVQVPFYGSFVWLILWSNWLPFYTLDLWFPATIFLASVYVSIADLDQEYRCLCPKV
jgi:hypothetical protein